MVKKVSNLEVLSEMCGRDKFARPMREITKLYHDTLDMGRTYLLGKPSKTVRNLIRGMKTKTNEVIKNGKEVINELSFGTILQDYRDTLFELNLMPTYLRKHPDLEDSCCSEERIRKFGSLGGIGTEIGICSGAFVYSAVTNDIRPPLLYLGAKVLSHGASAFYEKFRETKQRLETSQ